MGLGHISGWRRRNGTRPHIRVEEKGWDKATYQGGGEGMGQGHISGWRRRNGTRPHIKVEQTATQHTSTVFLFPPGQTQAGFCAQQCLVPVLNQRHA